MELRELANVEPEVAVPTGQERDALKPKLPEVGRPDLEMEVAVKILQRRKS